MHTQNIVEKKEYSPEKQRKYNSLSIVDGFTECMEPETVETTRIMTNTVK